VTAAERLPLIVRGLCWSAALGLAGDDVAAAEGSYKKAGVLLMPLDGSLAWFDPLVPDPLDLDDFE
jgi:hypothetical protein